MEEVAIANSYAALQFHWIGAEILWNFEKSEIGNYTHSLNECG